MDASPLVSCLKVGRFDLLEALSRPVVCVREVRAEILHFAQNQSIEPLIAAGRLAECALTGVNCLADYAALRGARPGPGAGECASIIYAADVNAPLVVDDRSAANEAGHRWITCITTAEVVVLNIQRGRLTVAEADGLIRAWAALGEIITRAASFGELL